MTETPVIQSGKVSPEDDRGGQKNEYSGSQNATLPKDMLVLKTAEGR